MELISAEAAEILGDNDPDLTILHVGDHLLERGPLKIAAREAIVYIEAGIWKVMVFCKLLQDIFLRRDLSRRFSPLKLLTIIMIYYFEELPVCIS